MALFQYKARSARGDLLQGQIEEASVDVVAAQLLNGGITPVDIVETTASVDPWVNLQRSLFAKRPDLVELILFCRQMYTLMKAGVPIVRGMRGLSDSSRNPIMVEMLGDITDDLESGRELSTAMARYQDVFSSLFVSMVRVGENTGRLDEAFMRVGEYLEMERDTRQRIKSALRYPTIVVVAISIAVGIINVMVIPAFAGVFERSGMELPWATQVLIGTSSFFVYWWVHLLLALGAVWFGVTRYVKTERGRYRWDKLKLRLPIIGSLIHRATLGRFARAFSMSMRSGVPLIQALTVVSRAGDNEFVGDRILQMRNGIERGDTLTRTAAGTNLFTPLVLQMMAVGEESGAVDDLLEEVAGFYEREVDYDLKNLSASIEPILIVAVGGMVLMLALGVFLPMWDLSSGVGMTR